MRRRIHDYGIYESTTDRGHKVLGHENVADLHAVVDRVCHLRVCVYICVCIHVCACVRV